MSSCNDLRINEFRNLNYAEWHMKSKLEFWLTEFFFWSYSVVSIVIIKRKLNEHKMRENWTLSIMVAVVYLPGIAAPRSNLGDFLTIIFFEFNFKFSEWADLFSQVWYHAERPDGKLIVAKYHNAQKFRQNGKQAYVCCR